MRKTIFALFSVFMLLLSVVSVNALFAQITGAQVVVGSGPYTNPYIYGAGQVSNLQEAYVTVDNPDSIDREIEVRVTFWLAGSSVGFDSEVQVIPTKSFHTYSFVIPVSGADAFSTIIHEPSTGKILQTRTNIPLSGTSSTGTYDVGIFPSSPQGEIITQGDSVDVTLDVRNYEDPVEAVWALYVRDANGQTVETQGDRTIQIPRSGSENYNVLVGSGLAPGAYYVEFKVTPVDSSGNQLSDSDTIDNEITQQSYGSPYPYTFEVVAPGASVAGNILKIGAPKVIFDQANKGWSFEIPYENLDFAQNPKVDIDFEIAIEDKNGGISYNYDSQTITAQNGMVVATVYGDPSLDEQYTITAKTYPYDKDMRDNKVSDFLPQVATQSADVLVKDWTKNLVAPAPNAQVKFEFTVENKGPNDDTVDAAYALYDASQNVYLSDTSKLTVKAGSSAKVPFTIDLSTASGLLPGTTYYLAIAAEPTLNDPNSNNNYYYGNSLGGLVSPVDPSLQIKISGTAPSVNVTRPPVNPPTNITLPIAPVRPTPPTPQPPRRGVPPPPRPIARASTPFNFDFEGGKFYLMNKQFFEGMNTGSVRLDPASMSCLANNLAGWSVQYYDPVGRDWVFTPTKYDAAGFIYVEPGHDCTLSGTLDPKSFTSGWPTRSIPRSEYAPAGISYDWLDSNGLTFEQKIEDCSTMAAPKDVWAWDDTAQGGQGDWFSLLNENIDPTTQKAAAVALGVVLYC